HFIAPALTCMTRRLPPSSTLFPYTTLFRSTTREKADALLARITPTAEAADLAGCDAVIEAVFEDTGLKHKVFQEIQDVVAPDALDRKSTRLNSSHVKISYAVFCLKKKRRNE